MTGDDPTPATHWQSWHTAYDDPTSSLSRRLAVVQTQLAMALDDAPSGPCAVLSLCAGDGRDVLDVLADHPRARDVRAVLVELDEGLAGRARRRVASTPGTVEVRVGDAGSTASYDDVLPVDVLLLCGIFGNVTEPDLQRTVGAAAAMVRAGGSVLWTRHRRPPDLTPQIRRWFAESGFAERAFVAVDGTLASVGHHVALVGPTASLPARLFSFVGDGSGAAC